MNALVNSQNAKNEGYRRLLDDAEKRGVCPLCENVIERRIQPIHFENEHWIVTENIYPHTAELHLLMVSRRHIIEICEIVSEEWMSYGSAIKALTEKFKIVGAGVAFRFGDTVRTGASIRHLHAHLIVPREHRDGDDSNIVWFSIGT